MRKVLTLLLVIICTIIVVSCAGTGRIEKLWNDYIKLANSVATTSGTDAKNVINKKIASLFFVEGTRKHTEFYDYIKKIDEDENNEEQNAVFDQFTGYKTLSFKQQYRYKNLIQTQVIVSFYDNGEYKTQSSYVYFFIEVNKTYWEFTNAMIKELNMAGNLPNAGYYDRIVYKTVDNLANIKYRFKDKTSFIVSNEDYLSYVSPVGNPKNVVIPSSMTFYKPITEEPYDVPVTEIADFAFFRNSKIISININSSKLESIVIPETIVSIGKHAFTGNSKLKTLFIPKSVRTIDERAFYNCKRLTSIEIDTNNADYYPFDYDILTPYSNIIDTDSNRLAFNIPNCVFVGEKYNLTTTHKSNVIWSVARVGATGAATISQYDGVLTPTEEGQIRVRATHIRESNVYAEAIINVKAVETCLKTATTTFERLSSLKTFTMNATNPMMFDFTTSGKNPAYLDSSVKILVPHVAIDSFKAYMPSVASQIEAIVTTIPNQDKIVEFVSLLNEIKFTTNPDINLLIQAIDLYENLNISEKLAIFNLYIYKYALLNAGY